MSDEGGLGREDYGWEHAINDLAVATSLTGVEAFSLTYPLRPLGVHPYDVVPPLIRLLDGGDARQRGAALAALLKLERE